jgi:predicted phage baseplate assembly protein
VDTLGTEGSDARIFITSTAENGSVAIHFGDGVHGARLPTGTENIRARYRSGLGQSGNLDPGTITGLLSKPLGVTGVTNPVPASGGANAEDAAAARRNIPLGLVSLARLVSVPDYQDFALAFAGIGKVAATRFSGPDGPLLHLTLAGAQDNVLDPSSSLWQALDAAVRKFGDPGLEVEIASRTAKLAVIQADVAVEADRLWVDIEPQVRSALYETFGFARREIGQTLYVSEVLATLQTVPGVLYVDLRILLGVSPPTSIDQLRAAMDAGGVRDLAAHTARVDPVSGPPRKLLPAELVYLSDILPEMLMLNEVKR